MSGRGSQGQPRLACVGITVRFGGLAAVSNVDLAVPPAAIVGLVGPNGAGKSTLFAVLSGLLQPTRGTVLLDGRDVTGSRPQLRAFRGLARTFQHPELFTDLTVREHLVIAYRAKHARGRIWSDLLTMGSLRPAEPDEQSCVDELIGMLGLASVADLPALGLPLGLARMLELGRALASSPTVVLLDEPSAGLDSSETEQFEATLREVSRQRAIAVLLVEHDVELVMRLCSTVHVLDFGVSIASGSPESVSANPAVRAAYLGEELSDGEAQEGTDGAASAGAVRSAPTTGSSTETSDGVQPSSLLTVEGLSVRYGEASGLSGVSFSVGGGKALAVLGANGAGKSSLARAVSGLVRPSGGRIVLAGEEIGGWTPDRIRRAGLVYLPESRGVFRSLTVMENLRMAAALEGRRARREAVDRALEMFPALAARRRQPACLLSGGEQQMLSLARALAAFPRVLIADEMSLGLAPKMVDLVFDGLARARQAGVTLIMIEQYVHRALAFADDCLVLQRGELAWNGPASAAHGEVLRHYLGDTLMTAG
ncbi:MAG TPA: ATP-binding cassette domain-containing protein [Acidimicrobiales bacterium]|jgi:ABC-type branched-subunit amino acid transport system ATPase component